MVISILEQKASFRLSWDPYSGVHPVQRAPPTIHSQQLRPSWPHPDPASLARGFSPWPRAHSQPYPGVRLVPCLLLLTEKQRGSPGSTFTRGAQSGRRGPSTRVASAGAPALRLPEGAAAEREASETLGIKFPAAPAQGCKSSSGEERPQREEAQGVQGAAHPTSLARPESTADATDEGSVGRNASDYFSLLLKPYSLTP